MNAVAAALAANVGVACAKFAAAAATGSASMLGESVHSLADCANELVLIAGRRLSGRRADDAHHPFGLHRVAYVAGFVVALLLFAVGGVFAVVQSVRRLTGPMPAVEPGELAAALAVVAVSAVLEGYGLRASIREARARMRRVRVEDGGLAGFWRRTKDAALAAVMMEDALALVGLAFAGAGLTCSMLTGDGVWDALGGLMVGLTLMAGSAMFAWKSASLLVGEGLDEASARLVRAAVEGTDGVVRLINMQAVHMDEDMVLLCVKVETSKLDRDYDVQTVNKVEANVRAALPWYEWEIYVEPDIWRADA